MAGMAGGITRMVSVQWEMEPCIIECAQGGGTKKGSPDTKGFPDKKIEQVMGIEPTYLAWKASVLPLNYTRKGNSKSISNVLSRAQCPKSESNQRHEDFQSSALPTELSGQTYDVLCVIGISLKQLLLSLTTRISLQDFPAFVNINFIYFLETHFRETAYHCSPSSTFSN